jgi:ribonuclease Z
MPKPIVFIFLSIILLVSCGVTSTKKQGKPALNVDHADKARVVLLGTGTPNAEPERSGPCTAVVVKGSAYIVDFGPGVVRRAAAAYNNGVKALKISNLKIAFCTHLHTDHTAGYPDLIFTPWVEGRDVPLEMYGPPGIKDMTEHILKAYEKDITVRLDGLQPSNSEGYKVNVHEIQPGIIYEDDNVRVKAFPVKHGAWDYAFGFRFETADRVIVISGDCVPGPEILENSKGCDVLVHEVYSAAGFAKRPPEWQKYHRHSHTSTHQLGKLAAQAKPGLVVLYHLLPWGATPREMVAEIKEFYDGRVVCGSDLDIY